MRYCKALVIVAAVLSISLPHDAFGGSLTPADTDAEAIYSVVSAHDVSARKAVYRNLAPEMKAALWRLQLRRFAAQHVELDQRQRDLITAAALLLSETAFSNAIDGELQRGFVQLEEQVRLAFPRALAAEFFARLGPAAYEDVVPGTTKVGRMSVEARSTVPNCSCSQASDWCVSGTCGGGICYFVQSDCGFFWRYDCTGVCNE
ncbi:MAG TPA: bacteriocin fulvocin C-related protein [Thermoanaerobaculia bacterium]|jgi:hypothetical protein